MRKTFTKEYMTANCGCYGEKKTMSLFFSGDNTSITIDDIINSNIPVKDKYWFVCRKTGLEKKLNQQISIDLAEMVLPLYERRYPNNKAPREAIESAKQFIAGHISIDTLIEKRRAAYAAAYDAYAAAYAAYDAAYAAYDAAYAADAAADAAAYDAYAAAYAAYDAADAAAYDAYAAYAADDAAYAAYADVKKQIEQYLIDFIKSQPED